MTKSVKAFNENWKHWPNQWKLPNTFILSPSTTRFLMLEVLLSQRQHSDASIQDLRQYSSIATNYHKISSVWDWRSTPTYCQLQSHVTKKLGQKSKIQPKKL